MSVKIRLQRVGKKDQVTFRIVAAEKYFKTSGTTLEILGYYQPKSKPATLKCDKKAVERWLAKGAQPTEAVRKILSL